MKLLMLPEGVVEEIIKQSSPLGLASPPTVAKHSREEDPSAWEGIVNLILIVNLFLVFNSNHMLVSTFPSHSLMCSPPIAVILWIFLFSNGEKKSVLLPNAGWITTSCDGDARGGEQERKRYCLYWGNLKWLKMNKVRTTISQEQEILGIKRGQCKL